jgi:hypothetical protein
MAGGAQQLVYRQNPVRAQLYARGRKAAIVRRRPSIGRRATHYAPLQLSGAIVVKSDVEMALLWRIAIRMTLTVRLVLVPAPTPAPATAEQTPQAAPPLAALFEVAT